MFLPADAELIARETRVPGLATVLDPEAFVAALRESLPGAAVTGAQITYIKYRPKEKCLVGYRLDVRGTPVEAYATAYRREAEPSLRPPAARVPGPDPGRSGPLGVGRLLLQDQAIALSVFPNDDRLGALRLLADPVSRERLLRELLPDRPEWWSSGVARLRYKPERRYVAQLRTAGPHAVLRIYEEARFSAAGRSVGALSSTGRLRLARPLGASADHHLLLYEWLSGRPLNELISEPDLDPRALAAVGAALAEWHRQRGAPLACRSHEVEATALAAAVRGVAAVCVHLQQRAHALAERLAALLARHPPGYCPIHGDFYADQVLLAGDEVAILDLDNAALGDPAVDLGNFAAHLENDALHGRLDVGRVKLLQNALLEGYRASTQRPVPATFWWHTAAGLLRLAPHPFRRRVRDWPERTEAILNRVEAILDRDGLDQASRASGVQGFRGSGPTKDEHEHEDEHELPLTSSILNT